MGIKDFFTLKIFRDFREKNDKDLKTVKTKLAEIEDEMEKEKQLQ